MISGDACIATSTRAITSAQGEHQINQMALSPSGSMLYVASGNAVRIWELNRSVKYLEEEAQERSTGFCMRWPTPGWAGHQLYLLSPTL